jgi:hypothetical protein
MISPALAVVQWLIFSLGLGFVLALPFVAFKRDTLRIAVCVAVPVAVYLVLAFFYCIIAGGCSHPGPPAIMLLALTLGVALGGLGAAYLRTIWRYVRARTRQ